MASPVSLMLVEMSSVSSSSLDGFRLLAGSLPDGDGGGGSQPADWLGQEDTGGKLALEPLLLLEAGLGDVNTLLQLAVEPGLDEMQLDSDSSGALDMVLKQIKYCTDQLHC